jgi:ferric-dicitrate binding protein FerR (iron transport regulator)
LAHDPALLRLHFTGTVFVASVEDWVKALAAQYPVRFRVAPNGDVELESSGSADTNQP